MNIALGTRYLDMTHHRTVFLRESGLVHRGETFALDVRRHCQKRINRQNTGSSYARNQTTPGGIKVNDRGVGKWVKHRFRKLILCRRRIFRVGGYSHEARAKTLNATEISIAAVLINNPFGT